MSLPPTYPPFVDDEDDLRRKTEIENMMRWQRENYFRNEPVQQEYRDVATRLADRKDDTAQIGQMRKHGAFDLPLAGPLNRGATSANADSDANSNLQFASLNLPLGMSLPDDGASNGNRHFSLEAIPNRAARTTKFNQTDLVDGPSASARPYHVAQVAGFARNLTGKEAKPLASNPADSLQFVQKIGNPAAKAIEWMFDFDKYAGEVEQFTKAKGIAGTIIFDGEPTHTDQSANNAFAHAGFSALYAYDRGLDKAKLVGDGREKQNHLGDKAYQAWRRSKEIMTFSGRDPLEDEKERSRKLDSYKDLFNNNLGRQIGLAAKAAGLSRSEVLNLVHEVLKSGRLITDEYVDPRVDRDFDGNPDNYRPPVWIVR